MPGSVIHSQTRECNPPHGTLDLDWVSIRYPGRAEIAWGELYSAN